MACYTYRPHHAAYVYECRICYVSNRRAAYMGIFAVSDIKAEVFAQIHKKNSVSYDNMHCISVTAYSVIFQRHMYIRLDNAVYNGADNCTYNCNIAAYTVSDR